MSKRKAFNPVALLARDRDSGSGAKNCADIMKRGMAYGYTSPLFLFLLSSALAEMSKLRKSTRARAGATHGWRLRFACRLLFASRSSLARRINILFIV